MASSMRRRKSSRFSTATLTGERYPVRYRRLSSLRAAHTTRSSCGSVGVGGREVARLRHQTVPVLLQLPDRSLGVLDVVGKGEPVDLGDDVQQGGDDVAVG